MKINEDHDEAPIVSLNIVSPDWTKTRPGDNHEANANTNKKPKKLSKCLPNWELQYSACYTNRRWDFRILPECNHQLWPCFRDKPGLEGLRRQFSPRNLKNKTANKPGIRKESRGAYNCTLACRSTHPINVSLLIRVPRRKQHADPPPFKYIPFKSWPYLARRPDWWQFEWRGTRLLHWHNRPRFLSDSEWCPHTFSAGVEK